MNKELDTFDKWWMMQSKIPYRDKKEIAQSAWEQSRTTTLDEVKEIIEDLDGGAGLIEVIDNLKGDSNE